MATSQQGIITHGDRIIKNNLRKLFKILRAQANPVYSLLVASPVHVAWIERCSEGNDCPPQRFSIARFIDSIQESGSDRTPHKLSIELYYPVYKSITNRGGVFGWHTYEANYRNELSSDILISLFPYMVAYLCKKAAIRGEVFSLTPSVSRQYHFKPHYLDEIGIIVSQCNEAILHEESSIV